MKRFVEGADRGQSTLFPECLDDWIEENNPVRVIDAFVDLRVAWRQSHRAGPPPGLSRDLLIRTLAHQLQERAHGGVSRALRRRLQRLTGEFEKLGAAFDLGLVPKTGTRLVRQWHGHAHAVLVREDGFEYEGQHYRSLTVIAERITGAHWSGPRFFGLTKRARALVGAQTGR
jgi:hypothetical protein